MSRLFLSYIFKTNLTSFRDAIVNDNTNRICRILDVKREYLRRRLDNEGNTALILAIKYASPLTVRLLMEQGAPPDQANFITYQTPLNILAATRYENPQSYETKAALEMAIILLDHEAYVDKLSFYTYKDAWGVEYTTTETPLLTAARTKNLPMAALFVERQANLNYAQKYTNNRPVHFAVMNGDWEMFDLLQKAGASCCSVVDKDNNSLLHCFANNKINDERLFLLEALLETECDIDEQNNDGRTPLMLAVKLNMINTCRLLICANADIDKVDRKGFRAIDFAETNSACFKLLQQSKRASPTKFCSNHNKDEINTKAHSTLKYVVTSPRNKPPKDLKSTKNNKKSLESTVKCEATAVRSSDARINKQQTNKIRRDARQELATHDRGRKLTRNRSLEIFQPFPHAQRRNFSEPRQVNKKHSGQLVTSRL